DDSLFTGPAVNPHWEDDYISDDVTTPVSALWVDEGVSADTGRRSRRPARDATDAFAHALEKRGVTVRGKTRRDTHAQNETVARVRSAPLEQIVQSLLERSDNDAAEVVLRHAAIAAGEPASFAGGVDAVRQTLTAMGIPWQGNKMFDGSGLARGDKVTLASLLGVLQQAAARDETGGLLDDLPVAGFSGSLAGRFTGPGTDPGLGVVRAKTGTLSGVHSLAGVTVDADGTVLAFVLMTDKVRLPDTLDARATLDRVAATLTACACGR
ncbi:MAG: D-alanyl-D-alanine carboxypeptidase/D-alanyl-D-alanine endopeptidase, partial [Nocardioidaceae bacterium]